VNAEARGFVERRHVGLLLAAGLVASSSALAGEELRPPPPSRQSPGNPPLYEVAGGGHVLASAEGYVELGVASWYGSEFHGNRTASGEVFDMHDMTAAHRTLPIPMYVEAALPEDRPERCQAAQVRSVAVLVRAPTVVRFRGC
jgi:hypothetical protein